LPDGRWQALVRDISARKGAESAARQTQAMMEGIVSIASDAIISIDQQQQIVVFNRGAEQIFGWSRAEAIGQPLDVLIPEHLRAMHKKHVVTFAGELTNAR